MFRLVSRGSGVAGFAGDLHVAFPIMGINRLNKSLESREHIQLVEVYHIILGMFGQSSPL